MEDILKRRFSVVEGGAPGPARRQSGVGEGQVRSNARLDRSRALNVRVRVRVR